GAAVRAEDVVRGDRLAAEATEDALDGEGGGALLGLRAAHRAVGDAAGAQALGVLRERVAHLGGRAEASLRFVLDRPHQNPLYLVRDAGVDLARRGVLR